MQQNRCLLINPDYVSGNEIKAAFTSLKANKSPGYDDISVNIVKKWFNDILRPLQYISTTSFNKGMFPDKMKIAKVSPIF